MKWYYVIGWFPTTLAIIGNALVIFIIAARKKLRHTPTNRFIISLAVADFVVGSLYFPADFWCGYLEVCGNSRIGNDIAVFAIFSSITNLCAMTVDRYVAIVKPLKYVVWINARRAAFLIAIAWTLPFVVDLIPTVCARVGKCNMKDKVTVFIRLILFVIMPCLFLTVTTTQIILTARRHARRNAHLDAQLRFNQPDHQSRKREYSSARVIVTVVAIFLVCYSLELFSSLRLFFTPSIPSQEFRNALNFLVVVNSAANPIAYSLFKRDIKAALKLLICRSTRKRSHLFGDTPTERQNLNGLSGQRNVEEVNVDLKR